MKIFAAVKLLGCVLGMLSGFAGAQAYPEKPIRIVVPFAPGGGTDAMSRVAAVEMSKSLGVAVLVENVAGAGGTIGARQVARAPADGYTLMAGTPGTIVINPHVMKQPEYDVLRDFIPITQLTSSPAFLYVNKDFPANSVQDVINLARKNPGSINYASSGVGSFLHLSGELFASLAKIDLTHVAYKGTGPALTDLLAGRAQIMLNLVQPALPHIKAGKLKLLAIGTTSPSSDYPSLPTIASTVPGYESSTWLGFFAPANTPNAVVDRIYQVLSTALKQPDVRAKLKTAGGDPLGSSPSEFAKFVAEKHKEMGEVVKLAKLPMH